MTIRLGLVGGGHISDTHARAARAIPGVEIAAVCGRDLARVRRICDAHGGTPFDDLEAFLACRPLDLVVIGSPSGLHAGQGIAAARAGLHVLVEKPLDVTVERVDALIAAAEEAGVTLGACFQDRFKPGIARLKQVIDSGALGRIVLVDARVPWYRPPSYYADSGWRGTWALDGGGALMNQGIHTVDLLLWLCGDVARVQARTSALVHPIAVEDTALAILEFSNGALGTLTATTAAYPGWPRHVSVTGTRGTAVLEGDDVVAGAVLDGEPLVAGPAVPAAPTPAAASPIVSEVGPHRAVIEDFIDAIRTGRRPRCDGRDGRRSVAVVRAVYEAATTGAAITVAR